MKTTPLALSLLVAALLVASCGKTEVPQSDRAGRLLSMAAEEAANIPVVLDRFTRQLNIADTQLRTSRQADAAKNQKYFLTAMNLHKQAYDAAVAGGP